MAVSGMAWSMRDGPLFMSAGEKPCVRTEWHEVHKESNGFPKYLFSRKALLENRIDKK